VKRPAEALLRVQGALQPSLENVATDEGAAFIKSAHRHWSSADTFEHFLAVSQLKAVHAACLEAEATGLAPQDAFDSAHRFLMDFSALARPIFDVSQRNATEARSLALTVARERTRVEALASRFETPPSGGLRGGLDELVEGRAVGWAMQDIAPDVRLSISLRRGDEIVSEGIANRFRADLLAAGHGDGAYGFEILFDGPAEGMLAFAASARESWALSLRHSARETAPPGSGLIQ
jgi:hypothetical protein